MKTADKIKSIAHRLRGVLPWSFMPAMTKYQMECETLLAGFTASVRQQLCGIASQRAETTWRPYQACLQDAIDDHLNALSTGPVGREEIGK